MRLKQGCRGWPIALFAAAADRITKVAARGVEGARALVPGVVRIRSTGNTGMAFSLLRDRGWLLSAFTAAVLAGVTACLLARPKDPPPVRAGLWLIVGGGLGNLYDRLAYGVVTDFLELEFVRFAIFNVADACICVGALLVLLGASLNDRGKERDHGAI